MIGLITMVLLPYSIIKLDFELGKRALRANILSIVCWLTLKRDHKTQYELN